MPQTRTIPVEFALSEQTAPEWEATVKRVTAMQKDPQKQGQIVELEKKDTDEGPVGIVWVKVKI